tara:strand:+ start:384 stop:1229 length:846 start_codon:yes stop_codon:yes gene_type:complete
MENLEQIKNSLQTFGEFQPTEYDRKGKGADFDNRDWLVSSIQLNRDSGLIEKSNFETYIKGLTDIEPEGDHWQIHRFGHWACGWFEVVILNPIDSLVLDQALQDQLSLTDYPILNEDHFSNMQLESFNDWVSDIGLNEVYNKIDDDEILSPFHNQFKDSDIIFALNECEWSYDDHDEPYVDIDENWPQIKQELLNEFEFETLSPVCNGSNQVFYFVQSFYKDIIGVDRETLDDVFIGKDLYRNSEKILENFNDLKVIIEDKVWNCFQDPNSGSLEAIRYNI